MQTLAQMQVETMIDRLGFPLVVIIFGAIGGWRVCRWFAPRLEAWVNRLVTSHEDLTKSCIAIGESNAATLVKLETVQAAQTSAVHRIETTIEELRKTQSQMHQQNQESKSAAH
jgi:hypothetical protein